MMAMSSLTSRLEVSVGSTIAIRSGFIWISQSMQSLGVNSNSLLTLASLSRILEATQVAHKW